MSKFIAASDALKRSKEASHTTEKDIEQALEEARFNEKIAEIADKAGTSVIIGFKTPDIIEPSKYFSAIKEYIKNLGYTVNYQYSNERNDGATYNYYKILWGD